IARRIAGTFAPLVPNEARHNTGNDTPYLVPACAFRIMGTSTMVFPSRMVIIACHQFMPASMNPPASVQVVITTLMPIQSAAMFHVDHVRSRMVVGARSRVQGGLDDTSRSSSTKSSAGTACVRAVTPCLCEGIVRLHVYL